MSRTPSWLADERLVRAAWSRLAEPEDVVAGWARGALGAQVAMRHVLEDSPLPVEVAQGHVEDERAARRRLDRAVERWRVRLATADPARDVAVVERLGGRLVVPGDADWPVRLEDLGARVPACLWVRGEGNLLAATERSVSVVGSRAATAYGEHVTAELAAGLADRGWGVVSGGAFGIDAAAHRAALSVGGATVAVLACGVDRDYPRAHEQLLAGVRRHGLVVSEAAPGSSVTRARFLERNRLIAAISSGTVVVEAAWRSGAISTAGHAAGLGRPLGAVPGPVTSATSAGCHRLLRDLGATCVTDTAEVVELVGGLGELGGQVPSGRVVASRPHDELGDGDLRVFEALPVRSGRPVTSVAQVAGLPQAAVLAALGRLSMLDLAEAGTGADGERVWRRRQTPVRTRLGTTR